MRRSTWLVLSFVLTWFTTTPLPAAPADYLRESNQQLRRFVLDNGMVCLVKEEHSAPVVAVQIWLGTGSIHEDENLGAGLSHYMEHMIFKGTEKRSPADISTEISNAGGDVNAYTSTDRTVFHTTLPSASWKVGVDVLGDAVMNASLPQDEWEREKEVVVREMVMGRDDPNRIMWKLMARTAFLKHPYRFPVIGYQDIFETVTRDDLEAFFKQHYVPDNMITVVVGDVDADEVEAFIRETFTDFKRRKRPPPVVPVEPAQVSPRFGRETGPYEVSRLNVAYQAVALNHPDTPALDLLSYIAGKGRSARLVRKLKEEQQLVFGIDAWSYTPADPGLFGISATFDPAREEEVIEAIEKEVMSWHTTPFTEEEITKARRQLLVGELSSLQTASGQANSFASGEFYTGNPRYGEQYLADIEKVTAEELTVIAQRYFQPQRCTRVVLSPERTEVAKEGQEAQETPAVEKIMLSNGLTLLFREDHRLPFVHIAGVFGGGLLSEQKENNGVTQLMADLLTRGTETRKAQDIAAQVDELGGSLSTFAGWNSFGIQAQCLTQDRAIFMDLVSDCLQHSTFPESELEKQRKVQLASIQQQREAPFFLAMESLKETLFPGHPYRFNTSGSETTVKTLTRDDLLQHHQALVGKDNMVLALFGDLTRDEATALAEQAFAQLSERKAPPPTPSAGQPTLPTRVVREEPKEQALLLVGYGGVSVTDPRVDTLSIIREAMSGLASDLGVEVREKRGLVYYVGALQRPGLAPGLFSFYAGTRTEAVDEVYALIEEQIHRIATDGLRQEEINRAQEQLIASHQMSLQNNHGLAQSCALNELYGLGYDHGFNTETRIRAIDNQDVIKVAAELLHPDRQVVSVLLPEKKEKEEVTP